MKSTALERALRAQIRLLETTLNPATARGYRGVAAHFVKYLRDRFPEVTRPCQLLRDPHLLGWLEDLWNYRTSRGLPLKSATRGERVIRLRVLLEMVWEDAADPPPAGLLRRSDVPRRQYPLPRPLNTEDDARLRQYWDSATGMLDSALYLMRLTGMRIGECADLEPDCMRDLGGGQWSIHVPHGKPRSERWTPVDDTARALVARLAFLRELAPGPSPGYLLPRPRGRAVLLSGMRAALNKAAAAAGIAGHIVPHQLRHTYATTMLRAGVSLPALMRLLGHHNANMTLIYVEVTQQDLHREYHAARTNPRYAVPLPPALFQVPPDNGPQSLDDLLRAAVRILDLRRESLPPGRNSKTLLLVCRRLHRIRSLAAKILPGEQAEK